MKPIQISACVRLVACVLTVASLPCSVGAQQTVEDKRLVLTVAPEHGILRSHAPLHLSVTLTWHASELIEGDLQLDWFVDTTRLGRCVIPNLALAESSLKLPVVLPPVSIAYDDAVCSVEGRFVTEDAFYDLEEHDVALQPDWRRILVVGVCGDPQPLITTQADMLAQETRASLPRSFDLEPYFRERFANRELVVDYADVDPSDVPSDPLRMTAFDLFIVPGESIAKLKPAQLDCLLHWVRAGGSLCVIVDAAVPEGHVTWLNNLAGRDTAEAAYLRGAEGHVVPAEADPAEIHRHRVSLGGAVVMLGQPDLQSDPWKKTVLFLWKARLDRVDEFQQRGTLNRTFLAESLPDALLSRMDPLSRRRNQGFADLKPVRIWTIPDLTKLLLPDSVRGLPLHTVSLILILFLLAIAPGDYLLLGWLKRRRWTWVLFPALSLLFTAYTMWTARQHLGRTSYAHSITVVDVGDDGRPVRTARFEMLYAASNRQVLAQNESSVTVPLDPDTGNLQQMQFEPKTPGLYEQPWTYVGRMPRRYAVSRDIQQWSPRLARSTRIGPGESGGLSAEIDWDLLQANDPRGLPGSGPVYALRVSSAGTQPLFPEATLIPPKVIELATIITNRQATGLFSVVSQLSPNGSGNWEDLTLLDASDPDQNVLIVISHPEEGQYVICRRLQRLPAVPRDTLQLE